MALTNIFDEQEVKTLINRINKLNSNSVPQWGQMSVSQMIAHVNIAYEMAYENKHAAPKGFMKLISKWFIKGIVTSEKPYPKNSRTAPSFLVTTEKDFEIEKVRLINYLNKTQEHGASYFEQKQSLSFGPLSSTEWNNMFYKHINHHLMQFGV